MACKPLTRSNGVEACDRGPCMNPSAPRISGLQLVPIASAVQSACAVHRGTASCARHLFSLFLCGFSSQRCALLVTACWELRKISNHKEKGKVRHPGSCPRVSGSLSTKNHTSSPLGAHFDCIHREDSCVQHHIARDEPLEKSHLNHCMNHRRMG